MHLSIIRPSSKTRQNLALVENSSGSSIFIVAPLIKNWLLRVMDEVRTAIWQGKTAFPYKLTIPDPLTAI